MVAPMVAPRFPPSFAGTYFCSSVERDNDKQSCLRIQAKRKFALIFLDNNFLRQNWRYLSNDKNNGNILCPLEKWYEFLKEVPGVEIV